VVFSFKKRHFTILRQSAKMNFHERNQGSQLLEHPNLARGNFVARAKSKTKNEMFSFERVN